MAAWCRSEESEGRLATINDERLHRAVVSEPLGVQAFGFRASYWAWGVGFQGFGLGVLVEPRQNLLIQVGEASDLIA